MYRVNEIFLSLQGEGYHTGMPAVFVRFSMCNLACPWCDTDFAAYTPMSAADIVAEVERVAGNLSAAATAVRPLLVLTGGEPSLQVDDALVEALHNAGWYVCIETNGTHPLPAAIDWVTCSPKEHSRVVLSQVSELKVVYLAQDVEAWRRQISASHYYLQPCSCNNTDAVVAYILAHPWWRLSLQTQKYLDIK